MGIFPFQVLCALLHCHYLLMVTASPYALLHCHYLLMVTASLYALLHCHYLLMVTAFLYALLHCHYLLMVTAEPDCRGPCSYGPVIKLPTHHAIY